MSSTDRTEHEMTPWLEGQVKPVHVGPYKRQFPAGPYSCWDGHQWLGDSATPEGAAAAPQASPIQQAAWRGLTASFEPVCTTCGGHGVIDEGDHEVDGYAPLQPCPDC